MATRISTAAAAAACNGVVDTLDGASPGYVEVRTGSQPATVATAATGTLLGTLTLSNPAFGNATTASPAVATASAITGDTVADATGTAGWFRAYTSGGTGVIDGSITATGGGGDMTLNTVSVIAGGDIEVTAWTVNHPTS